MPAITIYTKDWCPYCAAAKQLLDEKGAPFTEIDIGAKPEMRAEMIQKAGGRTVRAADFHRRAPYRRLRRHLCAGRAGRTRAPVEGFRRGPGAAMSTEPADGAWLGCPVDHYVWLMIKYALVCEQTHEFESWFPTSDAFEAQRRRGLVACPFCNSVKVDKQLMAPSVSRTKKNSLPANPGRSRSPRSRTRIANCARWFVPCAST